MTTDMTRAETREEILYKFVCWAAASAARQGSKIRGRSWYKQIKKIKPNLDELLSDGSPSLLSGAPGTGPFDQFR
jgi:hypothetical protein